MTLRGNMFNHHSRGGPLGDSADAYLQFRAKTDDVACTSPEMSGSVSLHHSDFFFLLLTAG